MYVNDIFLIQFGWYLLTKYEWGICKQMGRIHEVKMIIENMWYIPHFYTTSPFFGGRKYIGWTLDMIFRFHVIFTSYSSTKNNVLLLTNVKFVAEAKKQKK